MKKIQKKSKLVKKIAEFDYCHYKRNLRKSWKEKKIFVVNSTRNPDPSHAMRSGTSMLDFFCSKLEKSTKKL